MTFLFILVYAVFAIYNITVPGIQTDEILFGNAALGLVNSHTHISMEINGFPLLLMTYIGALKAYIYYPIFKLFGVNYYSIRVPMILLTAFSLFLISKISQFVFKDKWISLLIVALMSTDVTLIVMTRTDVGPIAIEFFLKVLSIYLIFCYFESNRIIYLYFIPLILWLGVFNKLNFIWFVNAFIFSLVFFIIKFKSKRIPLYVLTFSSLIFSYLYYFLIKFKFPLALGSAFNKSFSLNYLTSRTKFVYSMIKDNFKGEGSEAIQFNYVSKQKMFLGFPSMTINLMLEYLFDVCLLLIVFFVIKDILTIFSRRAKNSISIYFLFFISIILLILFQTYLVNNALHIWHYYTIYPFFVFCLGYVLSKINKYYGLGNILFCLILIGNINGYAHFASALKYGTPKPLWSKSIDELASYVSKNKLDYVLVSWGLEDQLVSLVKEDRFSQACFLPNGSFNFSNPEFAIKDIYKRHIEPKNLENTIYVFFEDEDNKSTKIFNEAISEYGFNKKIIKTFYDSNNKLIYTLIKLEKTN